MRTAVAQSSVHDQEVACFMEGLIKRNPAQPEFHQAVQEVITTLMPIVRSNPKYSKAKILDRLTEPDRVVSFRVTWEDDTGEIQINRGWRVQFNRAIGPYKGGLRFHPSVDVSILKFLGFEQILKNALTTLPLGGGKGGSDFNPKGKSNREVMRFCQAFMTELVRYIGPGTDIPAGDIGVGAREIGYLFAQYERLSNRFEGVLTGKGLSYGGSLIRKEATGYGVVYFLREMLSHNALPLHGMTGVVSGSGNVALYAIEKLIECGVKVVTASDSGGFIHDPEGIDEKKLAYLKDLKEVRRGRIVEYTEQFTSAEYHRGERPWGVPCDLALPCATQNEIDVAGAKALVEGGVKAVAEGANMPTVLDGIALFEESGVLFAPAKAANAGGVAVSGLEMSQNSMRLNWTREQVDEKLHEIMCKIHAQCVEHGKQGDRINYVAGANIAAFVKVADAMLAGGIV